MRKDKYIGRLYALGLVLACLINTVFPSTIYAMNLRQVTLTVEQIIVNNSSSMPQEATFTYRLTPKTIDAPLPYGSDSESYTFTISGTGKKSIGPINFNTPGIFAYELYCITESEPDFRLDERVYAIEIHVTSESQTITIVYIGDGHKVSRIAFEHIYQPSPGEPEKPSEPVVPSDPEQPSEPEVPSEPETPGSSTITDEPKVTEQLEQPGKTETPEQADKITPPDTIEPPDVIELPDEPSQPGIITDSPKTGDFTNPAFWKMLISIAAALLLFVIFTDRNIKRGREK